MKILVFTTVFPNEKQPNLGVFVRERMFKVATHCELKVVAPVPWFPFVEWLKPGYRPQVPYCELQDGIEVFHPRFFNIPGIFKFLDGFFLFVSSFRTVRSVRRNFDFDVIDSHFVYPDAVGAYLISKIYNKPFTVTLRESDPGKFIKRYLTKIQVLSALSSAKKIFSVCSALKEYFCDLKIESSMIKVVPNGVDLQKFRQIDAAQARQQLGLPGSARIIISIGWLIERKGFHRMISILPQLCSRINDVFYVVVGAAPGDNGYELSLYSLVTELKLENRVLFTGPQSHSDLYNWLSAADLFCLPTSGEGWANVFLEAMACGVPVVTSRVGGNPEVVCSNDYGILFDLDNEQEMLQAILTGLEKRWDREKIGSYARANTWDDRVATLVREFELICKSMSDKFS